MNKPLLLILLSLASCGPRPQVISFAEWKTANQGSYAALLDHKGALLQEGRVDFKQRQLGHQALTDFSADILKELVELEDRNFWHHSGVDLKSLMAGGLARLKGERRGGSTLSMQVANLVWPKLRSQPWYKWQQIQRARELEKTWTKEQILETYLNYAPSRGELRGLPAAARVYYGKNASELFFSERLWLYSFLPSLNATWARIESRACRYGKKLNPTYDCHELNRFRPTPRPMTPASEASHLFVLLHPTGNLTTTLDAHLQRKTREVLRRHLQYLRPRNVKDGAVLIADRKTGAVLAYVGGIESEASAAHVDHVQARRQAGSTLKPFLYALAIQQKILTMDSPLMDSPFAISKEGFTYRPENHDRRFMNQAVPLKEALGSSLNIPAIRAIDLVTPPEFYNLLLKLGFSLPFDEDYYGHSMALGSVDVTLVELVQGYLTLSQGGTAPKLHYESMKAATLPSPIDAPTSSILAHLMSEKSYRLHSFGLSSILSTSSWSAVKTGTSKDMRDNWCIGFTDRYVVGVWIGNSSGEPMWDVMGITGAGPVWHELIEHLHQDSPSAPPAMHPALVAKNGSYFLPGTEPLHEAPKKTPKLVARITSPTAFGHYAYDPEIPKRSQRIVLRSEGVKRARWRLNGRILDVDEVKQGLSVERRGRYELELLDEEDRKQDEISFYVRAGKSSL